MIQIHGQAPPLNNRGTKECFLGLFSKKPVARSQESFPCHDRDIYDSRICFGRLRDRSK